LIEAGCASQVIITKLCAGRVIYIGFHTQPGHPYLEPYAPNGVEFGFEVFPFEK